MRRYYHAIVAAACLSICFAGSCLAQTFSPLSLPAPTGAYPIGTSIFHVVDSTRLDPVPITPGNFREMMVQVWYPAEALDPAARAPYVANPAILKVMQDEGYLDLDAALIERWRTFKSHAAANAPLVQNTRSLPLLLFSHGLGLPRFHYTTLIQDLASHGYVVLAIDHPYGGIMSLPSGRMLLSSADPDNLDDPSIIANRTSAWAADASVVLDHILDRGSELGRFAHRIDQEQVGMLGHSLGGAAALEACIADTRFKACVNLDGAPFGRVEQEGLGRPTLIMGSGPDYSDEDLAALGRTRQQWERMGEQYMSILEAIFLKNVAQHVYLVSIKGTGHMSYSDAPFVMPETITRFGGRVIDSGRGFEVMTTYIRAFFDQYLQGQRSRLFNGPSDRYPEVSITIFGQ